MPRTLLCAAAMAASTVGCESTIPAVVEDTALVTDGTSFRIGREGGGGHIWYGKIPYSFTNRTGSNVYLPNCRGGFDVRLEMEKAGEWVHIWSPTLLLCLSPPIVIEPDEVYETTLRVVGCLERNCGPRRRPISFTPVRILWGDALSSYDDGAYPFGELIPLEERVSNRFTLKVYR